MDCVVALDAGTGSGRCLVFDTAGRCLAEAHEAFHYRIFADPELPMVRGFDLDAEAFWGVLARSTRAALAALPSEARIRGVIAASQREGCVFVDRDDTVLYAGPNLDARAVAQGLELQQVLSLDHLHGITGHAPPYVFALARLLWFRKHHDLGRVATLYMLNDWIAHRLSGARVAEHSNAAETMLYDVGRRTWSAEVLQAFDLPPEILPPLRDAGALVGQVHAAAAAATGLPEGTPVFAGGADTESALLGCGAWDAGHLGAVLGTTTPVQLVTDAPVLDPDGNLWTSPHVVPGRWVLESNAGDTGHGWRWWLELLCGSENAHAAAEAAMAALDPTPQPIVAHLGPAIFNLRKAHPFSAAGLVFRFPLLHIDRPGRGELLRAFLEDIAFAIRGNCEQIATVIGTPAPEVLLTGGLTRSATLLRILAAALAVPLVVAEVPDGTALGSAILATVAAGLHPDLPTAVAAMVRARRIEPEHALVGAYDEAYRRWREWYDRLVSSTIM